MNHNNRSKKLHEQKKKIRPPRRKNKNKTNIQIPYRNRLTRKHQEKPRRRSFISYLKREGLKLLEKQLVSNRSESNISGENFYPIHAKKPAYKSDRQKFKKGNTFKYSL